MFDKYCTEVEQHQRMLQVSKVNHSRNETILSSSKLIQLSSPAIISKANGALIIQLQTTAGNVINTTAAFKRKNHIVISKLVEEETSELTEVDRTAYTPHEQSHQSEREQAIVSGKDENDSIKKSPVKIQDESSQPVELDLAVDDIISEIRSESDDEAQCDDNEISQADNAITQIDDLEMDRVERLKDLPTKLIEDSKLLYKGRDLLDMMSTFYKLECDVCK